MFYRKNKAEPILNTTKKSVYKRNQKQYSIPLFL